MVARLLAERPLGLCESVIRAASTELACFFLTAEPVVGETGAGERATGIANVLSAGFGVGPEHVRALPLGTSCPEDHDWDGDQHHGRDDDDRGGDRNNDGNDHRGLDWLAVSVALADERWLNVGAGEPAWGAAFVGVFLLSALGIATVGVVTGWRHAKSTRSLANAAGPLGHGEAVRDLLEAGPAETR